MKPLIYLLVDFENVKPPAEEFARVRGEEYRLWIFHGPHQNKFDVDMVVAWQPLGDQARFVQSSKNGKNALDFHIAFCLGQANQQDAAAKRAAIYIVVSKDGGFDALFDYIGSLGCTVKRVSSISKALATAKKQTSALANPVCGSQPVVVSASIQDTMEKHQITDTPTTKKKVVKSTTYVADQSQVPNLSANTTDALEKVIAHLSMHPKNRPTKCKTLENHVISILGSKVSNEKIKDLIADLVNDGIVKMTGQKVEYKIPKPRKLDKKS